MKHDALRRAIWIASLAGLLSQSLGCVACTLLARTPEKAVHHFARADECFVKNDGGVLLRFPFWQDRAASRYLEFSASDFTEALRGHLALARGPEADDGALPWPPDRTVTLGLYRGEEDWEPDSCHVTLKARVRFNVITRSEYAAAVVTARDQAPGGREFGAPPGGRLVFPYDMEGATYQIVVEFHTESFRRPAWFSAGCVICPLFDIATFPVQLLLLPVLRATGFYD